MARSAAVTVILDGWPPPTIETTALVAALHQAGASQVGLPPTAYQHLNEVVLTFGLAAAAEPPEDLEGIARQIAVAAMSQVYAGVVTVHVQVADR